MSSLALMRLLESAPLRYDAGMRLITLNRVTPLRAALAAAAVPRPGTRVLEIGCGTGALTAEMVARGAHVTAVDQNPAMLEQARARLADAPAGVVTWREHTAAEIDALPAESFDAVAASFCLSEMSGSERAFVLRHAARILRPGGVLAVGDEVRPARAWERTLRAVVAAPQHALAWLIVGATSRPIADLRGEVAAAGLAVRRERRWLAGTLALLVAERLR